MSVRYGFATWVREQLGEAGPADLKRFFDAHGVELSDQQWSRFLRGEIASVKLAVWTAICEVTGQPLSSFFEYRPTGEAPQLPRRSARQRTAVATAVPARRPRPRPLEFYGSGE